MDRIWRSALRVAEDYTPYMRSYLKIYGYPEEIYNQCVIQFDREQLFFYVECDDEGYYDYEYGTEDSRPLGGVRNFFNHHRLSMNALVEQYICEELHAIFI